MDWFNGQLEITFADGRVSGCQFVTLHEAQRIVNNYDANAIKWAIYSPSPCALVPETKADVMRRAARDVDIVDIPFSPEGDLNDIR